MHRGQKSSKSGKNGGGRGIKLGGRSLFTIEKGRKKGPGKRGSMNKNHISKKKRGRRRESHQDKGPFI